MNLLFDNMELCLAALLAVYVFWQSLKTKSVASISLPNWLIAPAINILNFAPQRYVNWLTKMQLWAGWRDNNAFGNLAALKIYSLLAGIITIAALPFDIYILYYSLSLIALFFLPDAFLLIIVYRRKQSIREALPQMIDLLILCVDAGLAIDAAVQKVANDDEAIISKTLNEELMILCRDILLGADRERAYLDLYTRTGVEELRAFGSSLNQSHKLGLSIGRILRSQAELLRMKIARRVDERASKLPIYMSFPLWFFIMPALLIVLLAPALIQFMSQMRGGVL